VYYELIEKPVLVRIFHTHEIVVLALYLPNSDKPKPNMNCLYFTISALNLLISINPAVIQRGHVDDVSISNLMVNWKNTIIPYCELQHQ